MSLATIPLVMFNQQTKLYFDKTFGGNSEIMKGSNEGYQFCFIYHGVPKK